MMAVVDASFQSSPQNILIFLLRVLSPALVLLSSLSLFFVSPYAPSSSSSSPITSVVVRSELPRRGTILLFLTLTSLTYLADGLAFAVFAVVTKHWTRDTGIEFNAVFGLVAFSGLAALGAWKDVQGVDVWFRKRVKASVSAALILDILLAIFLALNLTKKDSPSSLPLRVILQILFPILRIIFLLPLLGSLLSPRIVFTPVEAGNGFDEPAATESSFLLPPGANANPSTGLLTAPGLAPGESGESAKYGTFRPSRSIFQRSNPTTRAPTPSPSHKDTDKKPEVSLDPSWSEIGRRLKRLTPYLWPSKSRTLQALALVCVAILLVGRVVNVAMPFALGELVSILEDRSSDRSPWPVLFLYVALRFLQGSGGLAAIRDSFWAPVMQYSDREMSQLSFDHLLNLSFAWHTRRKTGEILRVLDRGAAINHTLEASIALLILFNILPTFVDILVALVVFIVKFDWTLAVTIFIVIFAYVSASVVLTQWRTKIRRKMNERDIITRGIHTDCLLNYETVKYFCGEEHEAARYRDALREYQTLEYTVMISLNILNLVQNFIITVGLLIGSLIVARSVTHGQAHASDFVIFITYLGQLYAPLNQLGYIYRSVNQSLVDTEKLLKLLNEPTEINDKPNAPDLLVQDGEIEFDNVSFSYNDRTAALRGVSFKVPKGSSVALVGESGSGKSTILRLLYRFYDLKEGQGRILIDGKDIRDVTQKSLRQAIGVVPQDSVLFNTTIGYNIGYGKFGATPEEIEAAAKSAQMHDRIMSFPEGYDTTVGERGVRLSGGEKQRVAIARTLLKNPPILLLDEATSALDTSTEKDIQKALSNLITGRSSLSIAHRLSTISSADVILVLKDGQIIEQGSHKELLSQDGIFASMWADQVSSTEDPAVSLTDMKQDIAPYSCSADASEHGDGDGPLEPAEPIGIAPVVNEPATSITEPRAEDPEQEEASKAPVPPPQEPPEPAAVSVPSSDVADAQLTTDLPTPVTFPTSEPEPEPVTFPVAEETLTDSQIQSPKSASQTPGVTFETSSPPSRSGTPDLESEPKRKRISSQNFQRLARRISITARRQGSVSSMIPGLKKDNSPRVSVDEGAGSSRGEGSSRNESPTPSVSGDDKNKKKKERKERKRKSLI
ncbi:mitochondrial half-size ABC transporter [Armillaria mellea]|nr:mitochondrial half-size ABC transporter [Armillaria mellea]